MGMYDLAIITSEPCSNIWDHVAPYLEEGGDPSVESQLDYVEPIGEAWLSEHNVPLHGAVSSKYFPSSSNKLLSRLMSYDIISVPVTQLAVNAAIGCNGIVDVDGQWISGFYTDELAWTAAVESAFNDGRAAYVTFAMFHM